MNRRHFMTGVLVATVAQGLLAMPALAATYVEQIVSQLRAQGFDKIEVETTWLGRARIAAVRGDVNREIVVNPSTGEVLRDLWLSKSGGKNRTITIGDESDDDNSGHSGGDNSGHGGGGEDDKDNSGKDGEDDHD